MWHAIAGPVLDVLLLEMGLSVLNIKNFDICIGFIINMDIYIHS
jgi:hypothetical protein